MMKHKFALALVSWLILCANQRPALPATPPPAAQISARPSVSFKPPSRYSSDPCYNIKNRDVSVFCAEWKAADAAKSSADASWWTVYFAGIGAILTTITMAAAIAAAFFAKKAAHENKRSADAAHVANQPWLDIELKLHGVGVSYDRKGYSLQIELTPLNAGVSPAIDVRDHVEILFYDDIPNDGDEHSLSLMPRDRALEAYVDTVSSKLRDHCDAGPTAFPARDQPIYIEPFVPWDFDKGYPTGAAWIIVGLRYSFPEGNGETIKIFCVRSFGFPEYGGFEAIGNKAFATANIDPVVRSWPRHGRVT